MAKQITFEFEDKEYILEFTRKSVETMEKQGFVANEIAEKPMSTLPALFAGAFIAHHPYTKKETIDKIAEMYNEPIMALIDEPSEDEGNVNWGASW